ncbi:hypothetical protein ACLB1R_31880 [Escherichia coli]
MISFVIDDFHRHCEERKDGRDHQRVANLFCLSTAISIAVTVAFAGRFSFRRSTACGSVYWLLHHGIRAGADNRYASGFQRTRQLQWV